MQSVSVITDILNAWEQHDNAALQEDLAQANASRIEQQLWVNSLQERQLASDVEANRMKRMTLVAGGLI